MWLGRERQGINVEFGGETCPETSISDVEKNMGG